ncbi:hypothetical protein VTH82DRAFT_4934 [Thermothelomyces myriococcoides]
MRTRQILTTSAAALLSNIHIGLAASVPRADPPSEVGAPCGQELGDCAGDLTCIPLSVDCTRWGNDSEDGCPGTCQQIDLSQQQIYATCGGFGRYDDCDERVEMCVVDPRHVDECGPACDGPGICWPFADICGGEENLPCPDGKVCFDDLFCLPLRFGSDRYEKTKLEETYRPENEGWQEDP